MGCVGVRTVGRVWCCGGVVFEVQFLRVCEVVQFRGCVCSFEGVKEWRGVGVGA
jgi:hypothetical protein